MCIFGSHTFVPVTWRCEKQSSDSHSSTESEIMCLHAGLRMDGIPLLIFGIWFKKCCMLLPTYLRNPKRKFWETCCITHQPSRKHTNSQTMTRTQYNDLELCNIDCVSSNVKSSQFGAMLHIFEDNEAVIKVIIKGRSPTMRHVSRPQSCA